MPASHNMPHAASVAQALADYIHAKGLKFGIYSGAGSMTCAKYPGRRVCVGACRQLSVQLAAAVECLMARQQQASHLTAAAAWPSASLCRLAGA